MSQCNVHAYFQSQLCFTYVFGDMDPGKENHVEELLNLISIYSSSEGFYEAKR